MSDMKRKQVLSQLERKEERGINVMYLGDSENDNPAFRKSDISIGHVLIQD
jgi:soluble P-type ATPase